MMYTLIAILMTFLVTGCAAQGGVKFSRVCEHQMLSISCPEGSVIEIVEASYGRNAGRNVCPHRSILVTSGCRSGRSLPEVNKACRGLKTCSVKASNSVFTDPCVGTFKYLEVLYRCSPQAADVTSLRVCEHDVLTIRCPKGSEIEVVAASYGRNADRYVCPHSSILVTSGCRSESSYKEVNKACNGLQNCQVKASNQVFGDPCYGTYKYLEVSYRCSASAYKEKIACENENLHLSCPRESKLDIIDASYGRDAGPEICPSDNIEVISGCRSELCFDWVQRKCQGRRCCHFLASNDIFGDPCVGTYKYLQVQYRCTFKQLACEHRHLQLECKHGRKIQIISASYGRHTGPDICPHTSIVDLQCHSWSSIREVSDTCQNKRRCSVAAENSVFGDPCVGTFKYLEVEYWCE